MSKGRKRISVKVSKKTFKNTANKTHKKNVNTGIYRGGIKL